MKAFAELPPALSHRDGDGLSKGATFRSLLATDRAVVLPGVFDALTAVMAQSSGFRACYVTGAGVANTQLGTPDVGLLSFDAMHAQVSRITAVAEIPVVVDIDTGYGGPVSVMRTVRMMERLGVAALQMEDQAMPKRCGHFNGKTTISAGEMQAKIDAAVNARASDDLLIIARTDVRATHDFKEAIRRARAYREAGADVLFIEAPQSLEEVRQIPVEIPDVPLVINVVEGGKTPAAPVADLDEWGYSIVLHANLLMRAMVHAGQEVLAHLLNNGESETIADRYISWSRRQELVRLPEFDAIEDALTARWIKDEEVMDGR